MQQTKLESSAEAAISTAIGFLLSLAAGPIIYPLFGHRFTGMQNLGILLCFTAISFLRQYVVRRWAQAHQRRLAQWIARKISRS